MHSFSGLFSSPGKEGSELAANGPMVGDEIPEHPGIKYTVSPGQLNG